MSGDTVVVVFFRKGIGLLQMLSDIQVCSHGFPGVNVDSWVLGLSFLFVLDT